MHSVNGNYYMDRYEFVQHDEYDIKSIHELSEEYQHNGGMYAYEVEDGKVARLILQK